MGNRIGNGVAVVAPQDLCLVLAGISDRPSFVRFSLEFRHAIALPTPRITPKSGAELLSQWVAHPFFFFFFFFFFFSRLLEPGSAEFLRLRSIFRMVVVAI